MINGPYGQSWSQQQLNPDDARNIYGAPSRTICRPAQPLRLGDSFKYHGSASHDNAALFRGRMKQRIREASNGHATAD